MKCNGCGHRCVEKKAKFCSNCGGKLQDPTTHTAGSDVSTQSMTSKEEISGVISDSSLDNQQTVTSPKRPHEENSSIPKKKVHISAMHFERKSRKKRKKKGDKIGGAQSLTSDLSDISLNDNQVTQSGDGGDADDDSDSEDSGMDEAPDPVPDREGNMVDDPPSNITEDPVVQSQVEMDDVEQTNVNLGAGPAPLDTKTTTNDKGKKRPLSNRSEKIAPQAAQASKGHSQSLPEQQQQPKGSKDKKDDSDKTQESVDLAKPTENPAAKVESNKAKPTENPEHATKGEKNKTNSQMVFGPQSQPAAHQKTSDTKPSAAGQAQSQQTKHPKTTKGTKDPSENSQAPVDQNANLTETEQQQKSTRTSPEMVSKSTSIDPEGGAKVKNEVQRSDQVGGDGLAGSLKKVEKPTTGGDKTQKETPPSQRLPTRSQKIKAEDRLTIYFHAVLSKDFKVSPEEDRIFIRAGGCLGGWDSDLAEVFISRDLGKDGFLVEGKFVTTKASASESIPYKYVVYKMKNDEYKYEYIYKLDSQKTTNRCLFIKPHLLNEEGEWHQYDDIICAEPSKGIMKKIMDRVWPEPRKNVIEGRDIAAQFMLQIIFDLLRDWTEVNLKNFLNQLRQFYQIYANPFVYEEKQEKWMALGYDEKHVSRLLKRFMLDFVTPELRKEGEGKREFIKDHRKAATIMLYVWKKHDLKLDHGELCRLCTALCFPKLPKEEFLSYWDDFQRSFLCLKELPDLVQNLISTVKGEKMPHWVLVLPMFHLLHNLSKPFEPIDFTVSHNNNEQSWAGLSSLKFGNTLYYFEQDRRAVLNLVKNHDYLVQVDRLLSRSVMWLLDLEELVDSSSILQAELGDILHVFTLKIREALEKMGRCMNYDCVANTLAHIQSKLLQQEYRCFSEAYGAECLATSVKLLKNICKGVQNAYIGNDFTELPVTCMNVVAAVSDFSICSSPEVKNILSGKSLQLLSEAKTAVRNWISKTFKKALLNSYSLSVSFTREIEMWNNIISINFENEDFTKEWRQTFARDFEGKFTQEKPIDQVDAYCSKMEELNKSHPHIACSVENCALQAVSTLCQTKSERTVFLRIRNYASNWRFGNLVSAMIQKSWPRDESGDFHNDQEVVIKHLLNWAVAKNVFELHGADKTLTDQLSYEAKERIAVAASSFTDMTRKLIHGNIPLKFLRHILQKQSVFTELLKTECLCEQEMLQKATSVKRLLQHRQDEMNAVYHEKNLVDGLITMCHKLQDHLTVNIDQLEQRNQIVLETMPLDAFMEVHQLDEISQNAGIVTYFDLNEDVRTMAEVLYKFKDSYVFTLCWDKQAQVFSAQGDSEDESDQDTEFEVGTLSLIHEEIFQPCYSRYQQTYAQLKNGTLQMGQVDVLFKAYKGKYEELADDLAIMCQIDPVDDKRWIQTRVQQIEQYHELHLAVESAQVVMMVKETLCLQGDFNVLDLLLEITQEDFKQECLTRIDNNLMQAKKILVDITEPRRLCLQELGLRRLFVIWVKEALEDINELKVFVDLASISAGENDLDVDRVACFHDAVLGYSSVLYELKPQAGFMDFKEVLKKLWKALDNDPNLPKKMCDTARHLEWLKTVKESHGSVELSSLSLASAINKKGIYIICAQGQKKLSLDTVLKLQIPEEHDEGHEMRRYSLEDLRELQNKLMLMSGKGDQGQSEVDYFAEIFASVQRLAMAFISLFAAGNPLFRQWEANINCCTEKPTIIIDFNLDGDVSMILIEGDLAEHLPEICRKMEKCLDFWHYFMDRQRSLHYYLNYFTAEQIVYLCSKLTQSGVETMDDQALMMLSFIKPNCTHSSLRETWHTMQYKMLTESPEQNRDIEYQTFVEVGSGVEAYSETGEHVHHFGNDDLCNNLQHANGSGMLDLIWNSYMKNMRSFLPESLDIGSLGKLLEILANRVDEIVDSEDEELELDETKKNVLRVLPKGLAIGRPNLIVCPPAEILTSCISIYLCSPNEPLPTYDEVILCSPSTPYEQVELFLRRCLTGNIAYSGQKIYTMLYVDQLTYEVSYKVEQFFQRLKMQSRKDYRLILICSSDREHTYLPSAFSQYRLHMVPLEPLQQIQHYLNHHYTVPAEQQSAAAVFKNRLFAGVVTSRRAGVGKSLYIQRISEKLEKRTKKQSVLRCIRLIEPRVDENNILHSLFISLGKKELNIFHFDVTSSVQKGLHEFLFKLLILRYLMDTEGRMWKCSSDHLYMIEVLQSAGSQPRNDQRTAANAPFDFLDVFPTVLCHPPKKVLELEMRLMEDPYAVDSETPLMDDQEFRSEAFQRPYQYLTRFHNCENLDDLKYEGVEGSHVECLQLLFIYCGIMDPSWAELRNFTWFLNMQLRDCETSVFCDSSFIGDTLQGFRNFVVDFMILMAKDFATPSLSISDQSPGRNLMNIDGINEEDLAPFRIRKRWESEPHPYIFFNDDHVSMTFIGFHLRPNEQNMVDAIDPTTEKVIKKNIMTIELYEGLRLQRVPFNTDFDQLPRGEKIERLCNVLGIQWPLDPDESYELTTDNILKMLAIHMRFRCGIPVIIMGETGCGKTRLIKFLCELRRSGVNTENMKLVKVHGGTSSDMIYNKVREAESVGFFNKENYGFDSVLFFDEANTTEAISSIKEVLCDKTVKGEKLTSNTGLQIIAACNPYRKHTDDMIRRLESAGLGYRVRAEETDEKLGSIPLRQLVYRVQALPPSMIPLVWDFGQLNDHTEKMYIQQIVQRVVESQSIQPGYTEVITNVLATSQRYMRTRKDECSFVSLRDVERCMQTFVWFYENCDMLLSELQHYETKHKSGPNERGLRNGDDRNPVLWSLVMAVGVCYHACLENKDKYRNKISKRISEDYTPAKVKEEISVMQDLLLSGVPLGDTIARNSALKENVFMMVICIELRIPLFLVGKPGSSKSLSKTLVADAMQGQAAHSDLYRRLKQIHLVSFQCSPHSTPDGIINTFKQCARFQEGKNLEEYVSVVVLDEIGLAEDSPKMPLKTLHPLLEEGCIDDQPLPHKKVGFVGISNWALDPAKMNRGIFVSRGDPDEKELVESAKGICSCDVMILEKVRDFFQPFAWAYLNICKKQGKGFFGLRDYYSLIKMVFACAKSSEQKPNAEQVVKAVLRNFSGKDNVNAVEVFTKRLKMKPDLESISAIELVQQNISSIGQDEECRYLLILTKNYAALQILQQTFFNERCQPEIIFGSSFPKDQEYTQICRNINRVKICMETGQTIVLLNLHNLYESLYDALNQYYVCLGGQKYVDLGLGTHRVKCRVHKDFRLIVIEEKEVVYKQFPIPLINRLEKHYLDINTVLKMEQKEIVKDLEKWVEEFVKLDNKQSMAAQVHKYLPADVFIGYHSDTCASVIMQVMENQKDNDDVDQRQVLKEAKLILLNCATPDSVVRLDSTTLPRVESELLEHVYFEDQKHNCLADFIFSHVQKEVHGPTSFTEVTTFSRLLTMSDLVQLQQAVKHVELLSLQQFDTEHSFLKKIKCLLDAGSGDKILLVQTDFDEGSQSSNLIASAKYSALNEINKSKGQTTSPVFVYFITKLPRVEGGTSYVGFHGGPWKSVHIDDLRRSKDMASDIKALRRLTISELFEERETHEAMEVDDMYSETQTEAMDISEQLVEDFENVLDTTALVRSCVQSAVGMLTDTLGVRGTRRVELLLTLMSEGEELKAVFLKTVKKRLHSLLQVHDGHSLSPKAWVFKEAANIDALQEGGTFRHTLWKRVQSVVTPFLAQLISVIDRDCNLDLLLHPECKEPLKKLWLDIFGNHKLLEVPYTTVDRGSETKTIVVPNAIPLDRGLGCSMPFSWRIRDFLEELWVHALQRESPEKTFEEFYQETPLGRYIGQSDAEMQEEIFQRYLQDFIAMTMTVTSEGELKLLCGALTCCVNELRACEEVEVCEVSALTWVHAAYHRYKTRLQNLSRMLSVEPDVSHMLLGNTHACGGKELVLDVYAALACVEYLEPTSLSSEAERVQWLRRVKRLQVPVELVCAEESIRHYKGQSRTMVQRVQHGWSRIFSLSLFVDHMLLDIEKLDVKLVPLVLEHVRKLGQVLEKNSDVKQQLAFEAVIQILKGCKEGASERIFKFGAQPCPVCMGDPKDPLSLPCEHIYCLRCIRKWMLPGQMYCPLCIQPVPDDFELVPSAEIQSLVDLNRNFRQRCNSFFIALVSSVCFSHGSPPCSPVILHLLSLLMVEAGPVPGLGRQQHMLTKALSPFDDSVDKNPVVRSVLLKLLLKYSFDIVKDYLQLHLSAVERSQILEESDKSELYSLYINCLEDSMFERTQGHSVTEQLAFLREETPFLRDILQSQPVSEQVASIENLQQLARLRLCLDMAAQFVANLHEGTGTQDGHADTEAFLSAVRDVCVHGKNDWYRVYLIRKIRSQRGVDFVQRLLTVEQCRWMFPQEVLLQSELGLQMDQFLVCGEEYKIIREAVAKVMMEGNVQRIQEACDGCRNPRLKRCVLVLLALFREVTCLYRACDVRLHPTQQQCRGLEEFIEGCDVLVSPEQKVFAKKLVQNQLGALSVRPETSGNQQTATELCVHLAAVLLSSQQAVLGPLHELAITPANMQGSFLPTMPDDMLAVAQQAMGHLHWYFCPNGHPCTIGECGQPMELSRCPDCRAEIGGVNHIPVTGFRAVQLHGDRTQPGHILGAPERRDQPDMQDTKNMSPAPFTLVRLLTHTAMILGATSHPQHIAGIIVPPVPHPAIFLVAHLQKDLQQLTQALGRGADETTSTAHLIIDSLTNPPGHWPVGFDHRLASKNDRNNWETCVANNIISPQLRNLDERLQQVADRIRRDERVSSNPIMKLTFGDPRMFLRNLPQVSILHGPSVWSCRERVSLPGLTHIVEQHDGRETFPVLWRFLQKEAELRLVKFLPDMLVLQRDLVKMFQNASELADGTIADFLQSPRAASITTLYQQRIQMFLNTWNQLRVSLATNGELKLPPEYCENDLDMNSSLQVLLPRRQGLGLCSTALVSYLIALHNDMVYTVDRHTGEETSYSVSPVDLTELHVIRFDLVLPLVLSHCQYNMESGRETRPEYDLPKIQQQLITHFLQGKPLITLNGIPTLVNRHERNYENIFKDVKGKVEQESLPSLTLTSLAVELAAYCDVCEALAAVEVALGFLAMTGADPHMQLGVYLQDVLRMGDHTPPHIIKALSRCSVKHAVALWQLLSSLKSESMLRLKRDPFVGVSVEYKMPLGEEDRMQLTGFLSKGGADGFLLEMHEFIKLVLRTGNALETFRPDWGLKDTLVSYMERKDLDVPLEVEQSFPEQILLSHCISTWRFCMEYQQERNLK
ncbi:LOW QUALITY PROTEIN: E3 ubiquitin-protein ligase rnf213-alpha-like [Denticeps clupeoides]|uniref:LOW QUALITY PROTEIN: E3 ubiquitin-protein ligase rnf213-alpha-like n=1 Tax=Denticeps clupeoides TaxID=299321 RepID=UPI0010A491BB|nr:LOW QUALITY PROTEIN: E3 ubiquitin-protein ligase rnf213-alpha-like [Denticeps clupeoides]